MSTIKGNAVVGQSGGPTAVINQSLVGVIEACQQQESIPHIYGALHGVSGMVNEQLIDLKQMSAADLERIARTPSAALGSTRDKPGRGYCEDIFKVLQAHDIRYFFYIGGNDSAGTAHIVNTVAREAGYELRVFHVPKTIDNDLLENDHCPGYGSAATFVIHAVIGDDLDNRAIPGIKIDIVMGRHAGFLTAAGMLAKRPDDEESGPHLIYVPERVISMDQFCNDVQKVYDRHKRCLVVASEGISDTDGTPWVEKITKGLDTDQHGNLQLSGTRALADFLSNTVKQRLKVKRVRGDTFGYLQRSFPWLVSPSDAAEARQCGQAAVEFAAAGEASGSVSINRLAGEYRIETVLTPLEKVAAGTRSLPAEYINDDSNGIRPEFADYLRPLVGSLPEVGIIRK